MSDVKKILIIETAFIGDAVLSLALAEEIKRLRPDVGIHYLVTPASVSVMSHSPSIVSVHSFDKRGEDAGDAGIRATAERLNRENFDVVFSLHESRRTAKVVSLLNAKYKIGNALARHLLPYLTHSYPIPKHGRRTERIIELARFFSEEICRSTLPKLVFETSLLPSILQNRPNMVVLAPGSAWNTKKWLESRFIDIGKELVKGGNTVVVIGANDDKYIGEYIVNCIGKDAYNFAGKLDIVVAGAIISHSKLVIGNDSAPIHIATACGVRTVEIMGPTVKEFGFIPPFELGIVVEAKGLWCRPCNSHGGDICPVYTHECMESISSDMVLNAAIKQLAYAPS
jgi:heptosyltransferase-2